MKYWYHKTDIGTFYIIRDINEYDVLFEGKHIGTYSTRQKAVNAIIGGSTSLSNLYTPDTLGIPERIKYWKEGNPNIDLFML